MMTQKKSKLITKQNKKEIFYNFVNAGLAGGLVFLGAALSGEINLKSFLISLITGLIAAGVKFKDYWDGEKIEYCTKLINFI